MVFCGCQSILGIGDTTLRAGDGPSLTVDAPLFSVDAPLSSLDAPLAPDAPLAADAPGAADAPAVDAHPLDAATPDAGPAMRACGSAGVSKSSRIIAPPLAAYHMTDSFTVEAWVNLLAVPTDSFGLVAGNAPANGDAGSFGLYIDEGGIPIFSISIPGQAGKTVQAKAANSLTLDVWTHLAGTYNKGNGQMLLYVDGVASANASVSSPPPLDDTDGFVMGVFSGNLDEVRLSTGLRYTGSFLPARYFPAAPEDVAHFHFDEMDSSSTAVDVSPNANAAHMSSALFTEVCQYYRCGSVHAFGGAVEADDDPSLQPAGSFTVELFMRPEDLLGSGADSINLVDRAADPDHRGYRLFIDTASGAPGFQISCDGMTWQTAISTVPLVLHQWSHVAGVYDTVAGRLRIWQDGTLVRTGNMFSCAGGHVFDAAQSLRASSTYGGFARFHGYLDELRLSSEVRYATSFEDTILAMPGIEFPDHEVISMALYHFNEHDDEAAVNSSPDDNPAFLQVSPTTIAYETGCY